MVVNFDDLIEGIILDDIKNKQQSIPIIKTVFTILLTIHQKSKVDDLVI